MIGVEDINGGCRRSIVEGQQTSRQVLIKIPGPARPATRGCRSNHLGEGFRGSCLAQALEDQEIDILVPECEPEMVSQAIAGPVALIENSPGPRFSLTAPDMLFGDATRASHRRLDVEGAHEGRPSGKPGARRNGPLLKDIEWSGFDPHAAKILLVSRKPP